MDLAANQNYWDQVYENLPLVYKPHTIECKEIFDRYLKPGGTCFEVGCYPGRYLIYLGKRFNYTVSGIDLTPFILTRMPKFLAEHGVKIGNLYHGDFLSFKFDQTYDAVFSFGFVEHFSNLEEVIKKHIDLVKQSGTLIFTCPNFKGLQYLFRRWLEPATLQRHVLDVMNLARWKGILERNGMVILQQGYYRTADFWVDNPRKGILAELAIRYIQRFTKRLDRLINYPNSLLSPFMYSVSRKA